MVPFGNFYILFFGVSEHIIPTPLLQMVPIEIQIL